MSDGFAVPSAAAAALAAREAAGSSSPRLEHGQDGTTVPCHFCGKDTNIHAPLTARAVSGWTRPRSAGGTNALILRHQEDQWACYLCIEALRSGQAVGQGRLA